MGQTVGRGAAQSWHGGPRSTDVTRSCNWTADYQSAVRSGQHPDFLDFANRQPAATVSSGCQGPIIRLQRQIGDTCGRARAQASLAAYTANLLRSLGNRSPARCRPRAIPLRLDVNPLRGDRDHNAFALWVLSSSERAVFNSSLRMSQKGRALLHSGDGRDRTPTCDHWHVRVVVLVMPKKVEKYHGIPGRNQS